MMGFLLLAWVTCAHASGVPPRDMPPIGEILREVRASYLMSIPAFEDPLMFHSFRLGYQVNNRIRMGLGGDLSQSSLSGTAAWTDPYLYAEIPGSGVAPSAYTMFSMSLPVTPESREALRITSLVFSQFWSFSGPQSSWQWGGHYTLNPVFEYDPPPGGPRDRQQFFCSVGHSLSFRISDHWSVTSRSSFQLEHRRPVTSDSPFLQIPFPETHQLGVNWSPSLPAFRVSVGASVQTVLFRPEASTSRIGGHLALGF